MIDIKFRGIKKDGSFAYGSLVVTNRFVKHMPKQHTKHWIVTNSFGNGGWFNIRGRVHVVDGTVGQFTGMQDKNGVDIYVGDLIKNGSGRICAVEFNEYNACFDSTVKKETTTGNALGFKCREWAGVNGVTVIGNIHQDPELLS